MALRRWKPFLSAFAQIDATIEAAAGCVCREAFRRDRDRIVEALCVAEDDGVAEEICALLDAAMAESLVTLRDAVPASAVKDALASGDVVAALGAMMRSHASAQVRGLARDVVRGWKAGVEEEVATARAALDVLDGVGVSARPPPPPPPMVCAGYRDTLATKKQAEIIPEKKQAQLKKLAIIGNGSCDAMKQAEIVSEKNNLALPKKSTAVPIVGTCDAKKQAEIVLKQLAFPKKPMVAPIVGTCDATAAKASDPKKSVPKKANPVFGSVRVKASAYTEASTEIPARPPPPKKTLPTMIGGAGDTRMTTVPPSSAEEKKMENTKRKLHERYQEEEDAKRRRKIRVIEAPPQMTKSQMQGRTTQPAVMRARACSSSAGERRFLVSLLRRV